MTDPLNNYKPCPLSTRLEHIDINRDPRLAVREGHDAIEYALMHPSHFSRRHVEKLEYARQVIARVMEEL